MLQSCDVLKKEVVKGWELLLPLERSLEIPGLSISPMGVADQLGLNLEGEFVSKLRLTHGVSFPCEVSDQSVNS